MLDHSFGNDNGRSPNFVSRSRELSLRVAFWLTSDGPIQRVRSPTNACGHFPCSRSWRYVCASEQRDFKRGNCFAYWNDNQVRVSVSLFAKKTTRKCADHAERPYDFERCQVRFREVRAIGERKPFSRKTGSKMSPGPPGEPIIIQSASERSPIDRALACGDDLLVTITISVVTSGSTISEWHWSAGGRGPITMSVWPSRSGTIATGNNPLAI